MKIILFLLVCYLTQLQASDLGEKHEVILVFAKNSIVKSRSYENSAHYVKISRIFDLKSQALDFMKTINLLNIYEDQDQTNQLKSPKMRKILNMLNLSNHEIGLICPSKFLPYSVYIEQIRSIK